MVYNYGLFQRVEVTRFGRLEEAYHIVLVTQVKTETVSKEEEMEQVHLYCQEVKSFEFWWDKCQIILEIIATQEVEVEHS
jgi:hypothetical protein